MTPLYLNFALALFAYSLVTASRVILPLYALELGAEPAAIGVLYAGFFAFPLLLSWPIGLLADRVASRGLLIFGLACGALGMAVPYFIHTMPALYVAAVLVGLSFVFSNVLIQNLTGVLSPPHQRARNFSNASLVGAGTNVVGPLIAGFGIDYSGHALACLYAAGLAMVGIALLSVWGGRLPRPRGGRHIRPAGTLRERLSDKVMLNIVLIGGLAHAGQDLFQFYLPIYGHGVGLSASAIGMILASVFVASCLVRIGFPWLIARLGEERLLMVAFLLSALGFVLTPLYQDPWMLGAVAVVFGAGMGCAQPVVMMLLFSRSPEGRSGETVGLRQTANNLARVTTPPLFGVIASAVGLLSVFMISAALMGWGGWLARPRRGDVDAPRSPSVAGAE